MLHLLFNANQSLLYYFSYYLCSLPNGDYVSCVCDYASFLNVYGLYLSVVLSDDLNHDYGHVRDSNHYRDNGCDRDHGRDRDCGRGHDDDHLHHYHGILLFSYFRDLKYFH